MSNTTMYFKLKVVSPLHIGTGEVYEPMSFVVDKGNLELINFDPVDFLSRLTSDELSRYSDICRQGTVESIQELYKFMHSHSHLAEGERISLSPGFMSHYEDTLNKPKEKFKRELNNFQIKRTYFNAIDNHSVIPGSSIKGAIRTAVLNARQAKQSLPREEYSRKLQKKLLGGTFENDPFRLLKVSDFVPAAKVKRKVIYAVDRKKRPKYNESRNLYQILEVIEPGAEFLGHITIMDPPAGHRISKPLDYKEVLEAMNSFYTSEKRREDRQLSNIKIEPMELETGNRQIPLRIGNHSGAECVTVEGQRRIRVSPPGKKPEKHADGATTVWLASSTAKPTSNENLQAMGWAILFSLSDNEVSSAYRTYDRYLIELNGKTREIAEKQALEAARQEKEKRVKQERQRQEEEKADAERAIQQKEEVRWQAMTPEEQDLAVVYGEEIARKKAPDMEAVRDIWPKVISEDTDPEHRRNLAKAFKEIWQKEKKWNVKKKQKKLFEKVNKVKEILGIN